jgi:predicted ATPase
MAFLRSIQLSGFLSFPPDSAVLRLEPLNVLIGPNGSGKSNLIEAIELLHARPTAFAEAIRHGGGVQEWLWKGTKAPTPAMTEAIIAGVGAIRDLRYRLSFAASGQRTEVIDETIEETEKRSPSEKPHHSATASTSMSSLIYLMAICRKRCYHC